MSTHQTLKLAGISLCIGFGIRRRALRIKAVVCEALKVVHATNVREKKVVPVKGAPETATTNTLILFRCKSSHGYDKIYRVYKSEPALSLGL